MPRRRRSRKPLIFFVVGILLIAFFWIKSDYNSAINTPVDANNEEAVSFFIKPGQSAKRIAKNLEDKGLVTSEKYFYWYLRINNKVPEILAGRFKISPSMSFVEIANTITSPDRHEVVVTIQEGLRIRDIDEKLTKMELIKQGEFLAAVKNFNDKENYPFLHVALLSKADQKLEGYLFPDTYFIDPINFKSENLIRKMLNNFSQKVNEDLIAKLDARKVTLHDAIIMGSIIEKEVRTDPDMPLVSGILWKRLQTPGWTLGADATLLYLKDNNTITATDLQSDSPYNTRKLGGLPPSPIANPGLASIKAAVSPTSSPYWFYLTTLDTGEVIYAKTNDEHNRNRAKHL